MGDRTGISWCVTLAFALALAACSPENPAPAKPLPRSLPYENIEATMSWAFLCHTGAEISPEPVVQGQTRIVVRTARGNLVIFHAPTWQVEIAGQKCRDASARQERVIGE